VFILEFLNADAFYVWFNFRSMSGNFAACASTYFKAGLFLNLISTPINIIPINERILSFV
jgi:hypothetical protein